MLRLPTHLVAPSSSPLPPADGLPLPPLCPQLTGYLGDAALGAVVLRAAQRVKVCGGFFKGCKGLLWNTALDEHAPEGTL